MLHLNFELRLGKDLVSFNVNVFSRKQPQQNDDMTASFNAKESSLLLGSMHTL